MGFFFWLLCFILVVALVLLLFPFSVRIEFEAGERSGRALFFFFKKKIYEYEKKWGKDETSDECVESAKKEKECHPERTQEPKAIGKVEGASGVEDESCETNAVAKAPESLTAEKMTAPATDENSQSVILSETKDPVKPESMDPIEAAPLQGDKNESHPEQREEKTSEETSDERRAVSKSVDDGCNGSTSSAISCHPELNVVESKDPEQLDEDVELQDDSGNNVIQEPKKEKPKKEKPKLTDREFWTILLTPDLDARAFKYALKIIASVFSLFRIRFNDCFVEGIRTDYVTMGYIAALNGIMKAYPYVGAWDLRMDWLHEKELRAAGNVRLSITLLRIICFVLETLVLAGILAFIFWRRRAHVLKTKELPEIGFIRKKIVDFILED